MAEIGRKGGESKRAALTDFKHLGSSARSGGEKKETRGSLSCLPRVFCQDDSNTPHPNPSPARGEGHSSISPSLSPTAWEKGGSRG